MINKPFFTIVIPTYNRAGFIEKSIRSALEQTYPHFEIIVIDDGSTDNTEEIIKNIKSPQVNYYKKKNEERGAARNYGANKGKGDYINFFDSDDILYPNHLQVASEAILQFNNPEIFHLGYEIKNDDDVISKQVNNIQGTINEILIEGNIMSCNGVFLRKDIILKHPFNEDRKLAALEDWELWLRLASRYPIPYKNIITSCIINHESRSVFEINKDLLITRQKLLIEYLLSDPQVLSFIGKKKSKLIANSNTYVALHLAVSKKYRKEAIQYLITGLKNNPLIVFKLRFLAIMKHLLKNILIL